MTSFQQQKCETCKEYESVTNTWEKEQATETTSVGTQMSDLTYKDIKALIINVFKEKKKTMLKEVMEGMITMPHRVENINKDRNNF